MNLKRVVVALLAAAVLQCVAVAQGLSASDKKELAQLAKFEKTRDAAKADLAKHPKSAAAKAKFVKLNDELANRTMTANGLTPHQKYSKALILYRQSLKVDPHDAEATKWVNMIESIYRSMGRPIPH